MPLGDFLSRARNLRDFITDPQSLRDMAGNIPDVARGLLAQAAGWPVDISSMALRAAGVGIPQDSNVVGSTDWIGGKLGANVQGMPYKIASMLPTDASDLVKLAAIVPGLKFSMRADPSTAIESSGHYDPFKRQAVVRVPKGTEEFKTTAAHEVGHDVYNNKLRERDRALIRGYYQDLEKEIKGDVEGFHGRGLEPHTIVQEWFADNYASAVRKKPVDEPLQGFQFRRSKDVEQNRKSLGDYSTLSLEKMYNRHLGNAAINESPVSYGRSLQIMDELRSRGVQFDEYGFIKWE